VAINICGSAGGLVMPQLVGLALERTGSFAGPTLLVTGILLVAALLVMLIRATQTRFDRATDGGNA
jgi:MFS transporter, ACS family, tartrate transporter